METWDTFWRESQRTPIPSGQCIWGTKCQWGSTKGDDNRVRAGLSFILIVSVGAKSFYELCKLYYVFLSCLHNELNDIESCTS